MLPVFAMNNGQRQTAQACCGLLTAAKTADIAAGGTTIPTQ